MGTDGQRKRKLLLLVAASVLVLSLILSYLPVRVDKGRVYLCAICGSFRSDEVKYSFDIARQRQANPPSPGTSVYNELIGVPHEHEWVHVASGKSTETLFGGRTVSVTDWFPFRKTLLSFTLTAIETDFKDSPKEFRQELFQRLIRCKSFDEFYRILDEEKGAAETAPPNEPAERRVHHEG